MRARRRRRNGRWIRWTRGHWSVEVRISMEWTRELVGENIESWGAPDLAPRGLPWENLVSMYPLIEMKGS